MARILTIFLFFISFFVLNSFQIAKAEAETVSVTSIKELIIKNSYEMGIDPELALSIAKAESNFNQNRRSKYGAIGVFQLMPSTAKKLGINPYHINDNIKGGISYYKKMYKIFGSVELALAAYNAGPGNVKRYKGIPPFKETKRFISSIMSNYSYLKKNSDPVIADYNNKTKEINNMQENIIAVQPKKETVINKIEEQAQVEQEDFIIAEEQNKIEQEDFRMQQEAIIQAYLMKQGV